ncbi:MAG: hypothetical protein NTZ33_14650 [Bacteroidetes bacterium]|nr:hypothetical protein [Bacteroidota bacterium]
MKKIIIYFLLILIFLNQNLNAQNKSINSNIDCINITELYYKDTNAVSSIKNDIKQLFLNCYNKCNINITSLLQDVKYSNIELLEIENCNFNPNITFFPEKIKELSLIGNNLKSLPYNISKCKLLDKLTIADQDIKFDCENIKLLPSLSEIHIYNTKIYQIPNAFINWGTLKSIILENNKYLKVDSKFYNALSNIQSLKELYIINMNVLRIDSLISNLKNLKVLNLSKNKKFDNIQYSFFKLTNIEEVIFNENDFKTIPYEFFKNQKFKKVDLSDNKIEDITSNIRFMKNVEVLILNNNKIKNISNDLENLQNLKVFSLYRNKITLLPEAICNLISLEILDLSFNNLSVLPKEISKLINLKELHLESNNFTKDEKERIIKNLPNCNVFFEFERKIHK